MNKDFLKVEQNIDRLEYLLKLYKMTVDELLSVISEGLQKPITKDEILSTEIHVNHLKRIDKFFKKGLNYYLDPKSPKISNDASIFFRKNDFGAALNISAKKIVNQFEELKISLSVIAKLAKVRTNRSLPVYSINENPQAVAFNIRPALYPDFNPTKKEFLKGLISTFSNNNILVFEFLENWNKKEKANIDGFYLAPNVIVLKRQQASFRREIFTLVHELGHYLINEEEIDELDISNFANDNLSKVEKWCNEFAFYFLVGEYANAFEQIEIADESNDYQMELITNISAQTHLSKIALYTKLFYQKKISQNNYNKIKTGFEEKYKRRLEEAQQQKELDKLLGIQKSGGIPKAINSPLLISTLQTAYFEGVIDELDFCKTLNISPNQLEKYLQ